MPSEWENNSSSSSAKVSSSSGSSLSASSSTATSPEPNTNGNNINDSAKNGHAKDCTLKASTMSHDPTPYVARARVTRPTPPKPSCNPMQFVQIKPCNLYQSAQQQLKKVEEIKKVKEVLKEEPEDWQNNLDNWKSSRRKRVEHIIERVVEVKKLELEEHDRTRRKSKTFSEMMEERGERGRGRPKLQSLASYNEDEANDLSDLGIGTSSASGKSSISEDCEVHSIVSEPAEVEHLSSFDIENNTCQPCHDNHNLDRISSPGGYETSSTAPVASPDPYEYTYEGAIEDYKSRVSKASSASSYKKPAFEMKSSNSIDFDDDDNTESSSVATVKKEDLPKIDISKKRELFEKPEVAPSSLQNHDQNEKKRIPSEFANVRSIKDRLCSLEKKPAEPVTEESEKSSTTTGIISGEIYSIKERLQCLEQHNSVNPKPNINKVVAEVVAVPPLKDRLSSLQHAATKEDIVKKPVVLVDEYQLEMLKNEDLAARRQLETSKDECIIVEKAPSDDSGINTTDEKIDHDEPIVTEDEEDDDVPPAVVALIPNNQKHEEKVPPPATSSNNEIQGEFDSSVSLLKLKNLNTPTVVSLVDKPVVVHDVGGGGGGGETLLNSSKVVIAKDKNNQDVGVEVNHAQNLLKMFKMAFDDTSDVIEDSVKSDQVELELETHGQVKEAEVIDKIVAVSQGVPNKSAHPIKDKEISKSPGSPKDRRENFTKVSSVEEILNEHTIVSDVNKILPNQIKVTGSVKPQELQKLSVNEGVDDVQNIFKRINQNSRFGGAKSPEPGSNLILNIDNSQSSKKLTSPVSPMSLSPVFDRSPKSLNSVSSKIQQINSSNAASSALDTCQKSSNNFLKSPTSPVSQKKQILDMSPKSPTSESLIQKSDTSKHSSSSNEGSEKVSTGQLSSPTSPKTVSSPPINEALELALQAIDLEEEDIIINMEKNTVQSSPNHLEAQSEVEQSMSSSTCTEPIYENISLGREERDVRIYNLPPPPPIPSTASSDAVIVETIQKVSSSMMVEREIYNHSNSSSSIIHSSPPKIIDEEEEPYYQVPKSCEPLYQVPKLQKPIPLYENIEMFCTARGEDYSAASIPLHLQPPKEKPPPPPIMDGADSDDADDDEAETASAGGSSTNTYETIPRGLTDNGGSVPPIMRMNSTKRIKNEIRNKRSSFLGIEGSDDSFLELTVVPPPDMVQLLQEERRLDKQLCIKAGLYDNSDAGESRDSGVSENHSRQSSEPFTNSSDEPDHHEELLAIHARMNHNAEQQRMMMPQNPINQIIPGIEEANAKMQCIEDQIREQEEVLRVERELLQVEQEELKRQRDNLILRENIARRELQHGAKMLMSANRRSLQDINATINGNNNNSSSNNIYANIQNQQVYQIETDYCRSMSDLPDFQRLKLSQVPPPLKPTRSQMLPEEHVQMRMSTPNVHVPPVVSHGNMTRNALHALSATPKPKYNDAWVHTKKEFAENSSSVENGWVSYQQKRKSVPETFSYNNHWLVQEAEQRRIEQQRGIRNTNGWTRSGSGVNVGVPPNTTKIGSGKDNKPLPDAVIQTLTQRVQSKGIGERKRFEDSQATGVQNHQIGSQSKLHNSSPTRLLEKSVSQHQLQQQQHQDKILSVSGKKKCSHCGDELGRGAAMIIESLGLFYHINCFKCCVCHLQLSDGRNGTDVRVRNHKLHCQNCYSSDDGIKFSCV